MPEPAEAEMQVFLDIFNNHAGPDVDRTGLPAKILAWIVGRLELDDPGFHILPKPLEQGCLEVQVLKGREKMLISERDLSVPQYERKIADAESSFKILTGKLEKSLQDGSMTQCLFDQKLEALEAWKSTTIEKFKSAINELNQDISDIQVTIASSIDKIICAADEMMSQDSNAVDVAGDAHMMNEMEEILAKMSVSEKHNPEEDPDSILRAPTLMLGETVPEAETPQESQPPVQMVEDSPPAPVPPQILPDRQPESWEQTPNVVSSGTPEQEDHKGGEAKEIVDPPKETTLTSGDSDAQEGTKQGLMAPPSCEETALKHIKDMEDGPTKRALLSLCEASLSKVW